MKFTPSKIHGAYIIELTGFADERGFFARTFCAEEFQKIGIEFPVSQCSTSYNKTKGTLRGMHYQKDPFSEKKLVRCTRGRIYDVILDLRKNSPSYLQWDALELSADNRKSFFMPEGVAHGFQTLEDDSEIFYQMSAPFNAAHYAGVRWNDPRFGIQWPDASHRIISVKDAEFPDFS